MIKSCVEVRLYRKIIWYYQKKLYSGVSRTSGYNEIRGGLRGEQMVFGVCVQYRAGTIFCSGPVQNNETEL